MKKKRLYFPRSWGWLSIILMMIAFVAIDIYGIVSYFNKTFDLSVFYIIALLIALPILIFEVFRLATTFKIVAYDTFIFTPSDLMTKNNKIQFKTAIFYNEIDDIKIIASVKNSLNERIPFRMSSLSVKKYLKVIENDGKEKRICINHYTKKQVISILKEISQRMESSSGKKLNIDLIMQDWFSYGNIKKDRLE